MKSYNSQDYWQNKENKKGLWDSLVYLWVQVFLNSLVVINYLKTVTTEEYFWSLKLCYKLLSAPIHFFRQPATDIHRMQIWRSTRSAPGTSRMEARLVRLWCFVLTMFYQKSLASLSIWSLCFVLPTRFCVPECHHNRVESSTAEKVFFFSVSPFASEEKARSLRSPKERAYSVLKFRLESILENV